MWPLPFRRYMGTAGGSILSFIWNIPKRAVGVLDFNSLGLVSRSQCPVLPALGSGYLLPLRLHDACIPGCSVRHIRQRWQKNHFSITQSSPKRCRTGFQTLSWFLPAWVSVVIILRSEVTQPCCHLEDRVDLPGKVLFPPSAGRAGIPQARLLTPVRGWLLKSSIRSRPRSLFFCPAPLLKTAVGPVREFTGMWACSRSHLPDPTLYMRGKMCMPIKKIPTHFQKRAKRKWIICLKANQSESSSVPPEVGKIFSPFPYLYSQTLSYFMLFDWFSHRYPHSGSLKTQQWQWKKRLQNELNWCCVTTQGTEECGGRAPLIFSHPEERRVLMKQSVSGK